MRNLRRCLPGWISPTATPCWTPALYDPELSNLAFAGPHEAEILARSTNAWGGCVGLSPYVRAKYLLRPLVEKQRQPFLQYGETFLADPDNRAFAEKLRFTISPPGHVTTLKPSQMPGRTD